MHIGWILAQWDTKGIEGPLALSEICHYQKLYKFLVPMLSFMHLVHEILVNDEIIGWNDQKIQSSALVLLQTATQVFLTSYFEDSGFCAIHANCITVMPKDTHLALRIC